MLPWSLPWTKGGGGLLARSAQRELRFFCIWRDYCPVDLPGGREVTTGSSGSVRFLLFYCSRARGVACVKAKEGLQTQKTLSKPGLRWVATKCPPERASSL